MLYGVPTNTASLLAAYGKRLLNTSRDHMKTIRWITRRSPLGPAFSLEFGVWPGDRRLAR